MDALNILQQMSFERLAGSDGERKAAGIIISELQKLGFEPTLESFEIEGFETGTARIIAGSTELPAHPFGLNKDIEIKGELCFLENADEITLNKGAYKNKILLTMKYTRKIAEEAKKNGILALIVIGAPYHMEFSWSHRQKHFKDGYVNAITVTYDTGLALKGFHGTEISIDIKQKVETKTANNIVLEIPGTEPDDNMTYAVGHYDTVARSTGAIDNGGGSVNLLKLAEYFAQNPPKRDLKIIWFSGEELGLLGSQAYVSQHEEEIKERAGLVINIDLTGDALGLNKLIVTATKELMGYASGIVRERGIVFEETLDIYSSDNMPFSKYEIPAVNIARVGGKASFHCHTPGDKVEYVTSEGLEPTLQAGISILSRVLNAGIYPVRKEIDESLKEKIEKYFWNSTLEEPKLFWTPKYKK